jgi:hypothetical protein
MTPFTKENGYYPAGSYLRGMLVDSLGGGVCQVSTTLYNAVLLSELDVIQRNNHGLTVAYVQLSADAAIAESSNMDLIFENNTDAPIYIEGYTEDKNVTFSIYGHDVRPSNRTIEFTNNVLETIVPGADVITIDNLLPPGTQKVTQKAHMGYRAALYKTVYLDGVKQETIKINSSYYAPAPNYISVGPGGIPVEPQTDPVTGETVTVPTDGSVETSAGAEEPAEPAEAVPSGETVAEPAPSTEPETTAAPLEAEIIPVLPEGGQDPMAVPDMPESTEQIIAVG